MSLSSSSSYYATKFMDDLTEYILNLAPNDSTIPSAYTSMEKNKSSTIAMDFSSGVDLALKVITLSNESPLHWFSSILKWSLHLRTNSPLCEVHRGLARQTLFHQQQQTDALQTEQDIVVVILSRRRRDRHPDSKILTSFNEVTAFDWNYFLSNNFNDVAHDENSESNSSSFSSLDQFLLPGEFSLAGTGNVSTSPLLILLYGNFDTLEFAKTYRHLKQQNPPIPIVVRFLGAVQFEEKPWSARPTTLAGYGVRLDIRNVEYKVFDEKKKTAPTNSNSPNPIEKNNNKQGDSETVTVNLAESKQLFSHQYLAGVNLTRVMNIGYNNTSNDEEGEKNMTYLRSLRNKLWTKHELLQVQAQKIPPLWQRRQLPLQAATVLVSQSSSVDMLTTLTQISQDLPSVASTLTQVKIPPYIHDWADAIQKSGGQLSTPGKIYVNGRPISVDLPTFNVFELLAILRNEERRVQTLVNKLYPYVAPLSSVSSSHPFLALSRIQQAWISGSDFGVVSSTEGDQDQSLPSASDKGDPVYRVDIGRGWKNAVLYVNDIEKDANYRQWTRSFQQMFMNMQFGMAPSVRRNLYTMTFVMDPTSESESGSGAFEFAMKVVQSQYPVRIGLVLVDESDVDHCKTWLRTQPHDGEEPCPVEPHIIEQGDSWTETWTTARAVHRLVNYFVKTQDSQAGAAMAYVEYFFSYIRKEIVEHGKISLQNLVGIHGNLMEQMGLTNADDAEEEAKDILLESEARWVRRSEDDYGKALRFAAERGLSPFMGFLNGRPLSDDEDQMHSIFNEELQYLMQLIMSGQINDQSPRSIYGKLLQGPHVFTRMHPLLLQQQQEGSSGAVYELLPHSFDSTSLILQQGRHTNKTESTLTPYYFVLDVVLDYATPTGLEQLHHLLQSLENFPTSFARSGAAAAETEPEFEKSATMGYRILPSSAMSAASPLCPIFARAGLLGLGVLQDLVKTVMEENEPKALEELLSGMDDDTKSMVLSSKNHCLSGLSYINKEESSIPRLTCNGRVYEIGDDFVVEEDVDMLMSLEKRVSAAVVNTLKDLIPKEIGPRQVSDTIAAVASFLAMEQKKKTKREDVMKHVRTIEKQLKMEEKAMMHFHWNEPTELDLSNLKSRVTAVVDPVDLSTQRLAPLLEIMRDQLGLPLTVILTPASSTDSTSTVPITSYYRFVGSSPGADGVDPRAYFSALPLDHVLTLRMDVPEPWDVQQTLAIQDTDNLRCDVVTGCSDDAHGWGTTWTPVSIKSKRQITNVEYGLSHLLIFGQCYENTGPPNGLQLVLSKYTELGLGGDSAVEENAEVEVSMDGYTTSMSMSRRNDTSKKEGSRYSDTLVMKNVGYWQLRANPGLWEVKIDEKSKGAQMFDFVGAKNLRGRLTAEGDGNTLTQSRKIVLSDFTTRAEMLHVKRRKGFEKESLFFDDPYESSQKVDAEDETINVFSLATGHLYERFLKIMMLSVTRRTSSKVKFWLFENFLSPTFKETSRAMAKRIGCEVEFVTYKWPEWLRGQTEKQRIIWGYKILFLDVLFPLHVKKIIYVDADQVVRADLKELWDIDLQGAPYAYTPFCSTRETTIGYQFWREGFWKTHLKGRPYHISALYVVDLKRFREELVGDQLRAIYQQLSADPNSLANLDQDLPNYAQHHVRIFSLPQDWLWCESWCSDETKATAKTIDLCNNPLHKEPKVSMAKRIIDGPLFNESWVQLDAEVEKYEKEYLGLIE